MGEALDEDEEVQAKEQPGKTPVVTSQAQAKIAALRGGGQSLPESTRSYFEPRFGCDFGSVRVHADGGAHSLAQSVNARAFALGTDLVFNSGQYEPASAVGRHLLAHELTHVLQQGAVSPAKERVATGHCPVHVQRDLAVAARSPGAAPAVLAAAQIQEAIEFNRRSFPRESEVEQLRDVLGIPPLPAIIDEDFIDAVVRYQADFNLTQDGKIGPITASNLSREFRAEARFLGREGRELRSESRRLDRRSFTISVTQAAVELTNTGSAEYRVQWGVPDPRANGWIIQHVNFAANKEDCAANVQAVNNQDGLEYWEGWEVRAGHVFVGASANAHVADTFRTVDEGGGTRGTATITGRVTFMPNFDLQEPPWGHTVPQAGALPTMTVAPAGWSDGFARLHRMQVIWDDCVAPATHSVRTTP